MYIVDVYNLARGEKLPQGYLLYVQEVVILYIVTYYIKWTTTSWTNGTEKHTWVV